MDKNKKNIIVCIVLVLVFAVYTMLVKTVDVRSIGPGGSSVGFASINQIVFSVLGYNDTWYKLTKYLGIVPILIAFVYALIGLVQLIKRKSIAKIDKEIIALGIFYVVVLAVYIFFEKVVINYRPVILDEGLEASYPSSHTILALCFCGSAILLNRYLFRYTKFSKYMNLVAGITMVVIVIGRLISGVHWFTDIIGGVLISVALLQILDTVLNKLSKRDIYEI